MIKCSKCGHSNDDKTTFCDNCGNRLAKVIAIKPPTQSTVQKERTMLLTIVLAINYIEAGIVALVSVLVFLVAVLGLFTPYALDQGNIFLFLAGIIPFILAVLFFLVNIELHDFDNRARIIVVVISVFEILLSIYLFSIVGFIISAFEVIVLLFDRATVQLFTTK